jgi:hypothetical protein
VEGQQCLAKTPLGLGVERGISCDPNTGAIEAQIAMRQVGESIQRLFPSLQIAMAPSVETREDTLLEGLAPCGESELFQACEKRPKGV